MAARPRELTPDRSIRHFYGAEMRRYRTNTDMSLDRLSGIVRYSKSQLHRIETAQMMPPPGFSESLDAAFGTDGHFARLYGPVKREVHPDQYRRHMDFEAEARVVEEYAGHVVPGLLQTEAYARALLRAGAPDASEEKLEDRVTARMSRQERLRSDDPPRLWAILEEVTIRRMVGGPEVMREQLASLLPVVDTATTKMQLLPNNHGEHRLLGGSLTLHTLPDDTTVAYEEGIDAGRLYEDADSVRERRHAYDALRAYALSPKETAAWIRSAMEDCKPCEPPDQT
ncbi:helix-turn-helix domain-containing protein [Streptomyces gobiensis]|uniref:helix-turn-helix domain-containing protein n=1 Tax=Streptomyces gobiensis TaxID=2875706 RepID=UPI001E33C6FC|nr:helix-turn-helix transcriptional regulator [Streptomyces gobiensis]UGY91976.1 helix-turn-helix domain-containing protein [Streptomyces gobiensis]